jgi:thiamine biosynthesis lipoprotein
LFLSDECDACLRLAIEAAEFTTGRFDPCAGSMVDAIKGGAESAPSPCGIISMDPSRPLVTCAEAGRVLDLGAIGKGYALERMAAILAAHGISDALLTSGASTMLAMGERSWPVDLPHSSGTMRHALRGVALAASGSSQQGQHIVNPLDGAPARHFESVWVIHPRAAMADAFSTACFVMTPEEIDEFLKTLPPGSRVISDPDWKVRVRLPLG